MQGGYLLYSAPNVSKMYIKELNNKQQQPFITLVDKILVAKKKQIETDTIEAELDELFYNLFDLSKQERLTIENSLAKTK